MIRMKILKLFRRGNEYFLGRRVHCRNVEYGNRCNIAYEVDASNCSIGKRTSVGRYTTLRNCNIGNYCAISWNCSLGAQSHHYDLGSCSSAFWQTRFGLVKQDKKDVTKNSPTTTIGSDVWIGCNVVVKAGVNIGDGAVIGAGAIITKDVEPYAIVAGVPGERIAYRFDEEIRANLLASKWWLWEDDLLRQNIDLFRQKMSKDISRTILKISREEQRSRIDI